MVWRRVSCTERKRWRGDSREAASQLRTVTGTRSGFRPPAASLVSSEPLVRIMFIMLNKSSLEHRRVWPHGGRSPDCSDDKAHKFAGLRPSAIAGSSEGLVSCAAAKLYVQETGNQKSSIKDHKRIPSN